MKLRLPDSEIKKCFVEADAVNTTNQAVSYESEFEYFARTKVIEEDTNRLLEDIRGRVSDLLAVVTDAGFILPPFISHLKDGVGKVGM